MSIAIRKVETSTDFKPFFEFPWTLYKNDPNWVPPLLSMRREQFAADSENLGRAHLAHQAAPDKTLAPMCSRMLP